eukprot:6475879-Amphidinium_carterae.1
MTYFVTYYSVRLLMDAEGLPVWSLASIWRGSEDAASSESKPLVQEMHFILFQDQLLAHWLSLPVWACGVSGDASEALEGTAGWKLSLKRSTRSA